MLLSDPISLSLSLSLYIYIYIYLFIYLFIYLLFIIIHFLFNYWFKKLTFVGVTIIQKYMCINFGTRYQCNLDVLVNVYGTLWILWTHCHSGCVLSLDPELGLLWHLCEFGWFNKLWAWLYILIMLEITSVVLVDRVCSTIFCLWLFLYTMQSTACLFTYLLNEQCLWFLRWRKKPKLQFLPQLHLSSLWGLH